MPTLEADVDGVLTLGGTNFGGFQVFDGGEESAEVVDDFPPGSQYADKSVAKASLSNITVSRSWVEGRDRPLYNLLKGRTGMEGTAGRIVRDEARNIANVEPFTVKLIRRRGPRGDTNGGTTKAMFEIELATVGN